MEEIVSEYRKINIKLITSAVTIVLLVVLMAIKHHIISEMTKAVIIVVIGLSFVSAAVIPPISTKDGNESYFQRTDILSLLLVASLCLQLFFSFAFFKGTVTGNSMYPTLVDQQDVIVRSTKNVKKGDIVVVYVDSAINKLAYGVKDDELLIKRVIGVSGDQVWAKDGVVYVNGVAEEGRFSTIHTSDFTIEGVGKNNNNLEFDGITVPKGYILVLGDNRGSSSNT